MRNKEPELGAKLKDHRNVVVQLLMLSSSMSCSWTSPTLRIEQIRLMHVFRRELYHFREMKAIGLPAHSSGGFVASPDIRVAWAGSQPRSDLLNAFHFRCEKSELSHVLGRFPVYGL